MHISRSLEIPNWFEKVISSLNVRASLCTLLRQDLEIITEFDHAERELYGLYFFHVLKQVSIYFSCLGERSNAF